MSTQDPEGPIDGPRRAMLRLGIAAAAFYAAPAVTQLGGRAHASSFSASLRPPRRVARRRAADPAPPPEIVIGTTVAGDIQTIADQGFRLLARDSIGMVGFELARFALPDGVGVEQARQQIAAQFPTALFDVNHVYAPEEFTCDADGCMAFDAIGWQHVRPACAAGAMIGLVDTPINTDHAALRDVDHRDQAGRNLADSFDVARAIDRLVQRGLGVINLSFAGPDNAVLKRVVEAALERDSGPAAQPLFPAAYEGVIAVTAVDHRNRVYRQANAGDHIDFAAPGVRLWTAASISGGRFRSGTSYAAPFVTAALGLARARAPEATSQELVEMLSSRAADLGQTGKDATFGWGLVQADELCGVPMNVSFPAGG